MLHPQARALLELMEQRGIVPTHTLAHTEARRLYRERRAFTQPPAPEVGALRELEAPGPVGPIPLRLYRPLGTAPASALPVLVYFHGGGWVIGDLDTHDTLCRELANTAGIAVVSVDYRLAPEHRFPAAFDDSLVATRWVVGQAASLGLDGSRLAVGGDSAGGNLAAAVSIALRDAGEAPAFQLLIYPATDQRRGQASYRMTLHPLTLSAVTVAYFHDFYITDPAHDLDWRASPLLAEDLSKLPPAFVLTAGHDPLRDEGLQYAQRLSESGVRTTLVNFERQMHGFVLMGRVIDEANTAVALCAAQLRSALAR
jgi:acetyl esterase